MGLPGLLSPKPDNSRHGRATSSLAQQMNRSRRRPLARLGAIAAMAAVVAALPVAAASAGTVPDNKLGWSSCLWPVGKTITVAVDPAFPLPNPSFSDRLNEAIVRWDGVLRTSRRGGDLIRVADWPADILIQYRALEGSDTN